MKSTGKNLPAIVIGAFILCALGLFVFRQATRYQDEQERLEKILAVDQKVIEEARHAFPNPDLPNLLKRDLDVLRERAPDSMDLDGFTRILREEAPKHRVEARISPVSGEEPFPESPGVKVQILRLSVSGKGSDISDLVWALRERRFIAVRTFAREGRGAALTVTLVSYAWPAMRDPGKGHPSLDPIGSGPWLIWPLSSRIAKLRGQCQQARASADQVRTSRFDEGELRTFKDQYAKCVDDLRRAMDTDDRGWADFLKAL